MRSVDEVRELQSHFHPRWFGLAENTDGTGGSQT